MSVRVVADFRIRPEAVEEFLAATLQLRGETHAKDAGCIAYDLFRDKADPLHLTMIEEWEDQAALDTHLAAEHFQRAFPVIEASSSAPAVICVYEPAL